MTRFWFIRHGPTHAKTMVGWTDLPADLTDTDKIARLEAVLPNAPIISSDLSRTRATADALQIDRLRLIDDPDLREFHYGAWENQPFEKIDSPALRQYFEDPGPHRAPGGESWNDVARRVSAAMTRLLEWPDIIVVAHMGVILTQWAKANGISPYQALAQKIEPLSLTRLDWDGAKYQAYEANRQP